MAGVEGRVAVITGAGGGLGRQHALLLAARGAKVVVNDLGSNRAGEGGGSEMADGVVAEITGAGGEAVANYDNVATSEGGRGVVQTALDAFGRVDIVVNNAGILRDVTFHKMTDEQWDAMLAIHLTAPFRLIRAAIPYMREIAKREIEVNGVTKARKIVNVSSTTGTRGNIGQANYASGKAGMIGLTKTLAKEWGAFNIQVNAVAFGFMDTRLTQSDREGDFTERDGSKIKLGMPDKVRDSIFSQIPMRRPGTVDEAAGALLFFASDLSNYVSGQVLEVAGGM